MGGSRSLKLLAIQALVTFAVGQNSSSTVVSFSLPQSAGNATLRQQQVAINRAGYQYAYSPLVQSSYFLGGPLGDPLVATEVSELTAEVGPLKVSLQTDATAAQTALTLEGGLSQLSDYRRVYDGQWKLSNPMGTDPGLLSNYTEDLLFSMRRLSSNPFGLARVNPSTAIVFPDNTNSAALKLTGQIVSSLQRAGRLFVSDHSDMAPLKLNSGMYSAACTAYFYIDPNMGDFLPLSITTNIGANLTYTPLDSAQDWFLGKSLFENNEVFYIACFHFSATHSLAEIVHIASLRTMADQHPVRGFLDRIMFRAYGIRPVGATLVFNQGGSFDQNFAYGFNGFDTYTAQIYHNTVAGRFQSLYFPNYFTNQGLLNSHVGPPLTHFPYYEDVSPIHDVIQQFASSYVQAYYTSDAMVACDSELQSWVAEANGPAKIIDFPSAIKDRQTLIAVLTQMAYLTGVLHHSLNSGALARSWTLPLSPTSIWKPLPTTKGIKSAVPYLPNVSQNVSQVTIVNTFNQPDLTAIGATLENMFQNQQFNALTTPSVRVAATTFMASMKALGQQIDTKHFDGSGLCQGMPFIWRDVSPDIIPFFLSI